MNILEQSYNGTPAGAQNLMTFRCPASGLWHCYILASCNAAYSIILEHFLVGSPTGGMAGRPLGQVFYFGANVSHVFPFELPASEGDTLVIRVTAALTGYLSVSFIGTYRGQLP